MKREDLIQEIVENMARCQRPANFTGWQDIGLSHSQIGMLFMMHFYKHLRVKQVADNLGVTKSAASQMLDSLTNKGLVVRQTDEKDRRVIRFSLSAKGSQVFKKIHKLKSAGLRMRLDALTTEELDLLAKLSHKMAAVNIKTKD